MCIRDRSVPSQVTIDGNVVQDRNGIYIDYNQGRVLVDTGVFGNNKNLDIKGTFAYKTINTYITDETEEAVIVNSDFIISPLNQTYLQQNGGFNDKIYTIPAVFLTLANSENHPFAFGGLDRTELNLRAVVVADSNYTLDGVLSLFRDSARTCSVSYTHLRAHET